MLIVRADRRILLVGLRFLRKLPILVVDKIWTTDLILGFIDHQFGSHNGAHSKSSINETDYNQQNKEVKEDIKNLLYGVPEDWYSAPMGDFNSSRYNYCNCKYTLVKKVQILIFVFFVLDSVICMSA